MIDRRRLLAGSAAGLLIDALPGIAPRAVAQAVKKPVHIIVGFAAGGGTDVTARVLADGAAAWRQASRVTPGRAKARTRNPCSAAAVMDSGFAAIAR